MTHLLDTLGCQVVKCSNHGGNRPFQTIAPWDVQTVYFNGNDAGVIDPLFLIDGAAILRETRNDHGLIPAVYFVVPKTSTGGKGFADKCSALVTTLGGVERVEVVMFDNEKVPLTFQAEYMDRWDQLRPWRPTIYSVEPIQDESVNDYARMLRRNQSGQRVRKVTFQCYQGGMQPLQPRDVRRAQFGTARLQDDDICPTIDPAQPAAYIASAAACGSRGMVLFESARIRPT